VNREEIVWIKATYDEYRQRLVAELARHPGAPLDELDMDMVKAFMFRLKRMGRTGLRIAHYESGYVPGESPVYWVNGAGNLLLWIRDRKFRPKFHEVDEEAARLGLIETSAELTGETAEQRRIIEAPDKYKELAAKASDGLLGLPEATMPDTIPSWVNRFPSLGDGGYDKVLMNCLLHLSEGKAHATIDSINRDRERKVALRAENAKLKTQRAEIKERATGSQSAAAMMLRHLNNQVVASSAD